MGRRGQRGSPGEASEGMLQVRVVVRPRGEGRGAAPHEERLQRLVRQAVAGGQLQEAADVRQVDRLPADTLHQRPRRLSLPGRVTIAGQAERCGLCGGLNDTTTGLTKNTQKNLPNLPKKISQKRDKRKTTN